MVDPNLHPYGLLEGATERVQRRYDRLMHLYAVLHGPTFHEMLRQFVSIMNSSLPEELQQIISGLYRIEACITWLDVVNDAIHSHSTGNVHDDTTRNTARRRSNYIHATGISDRLFTIDPTCFANKYPSGHTLTLRDMLYEVELCRVGAMTKVNQSLKSLQTQVIPEFARIRNFTVITLPSFLQGVNEYAKSRGARLSKLV